MESSNLTTKAQEAIKQMLSVMSVEQILKFRERMKQVHYAQLQMVSEILQQKGYVEPHHDLIVHARD